MSTSESLRVRADLRTLARTSRRRWTRSRPRRGDPGPRPTSDGDVRRRRRLLGASAIAAVAAAVPGYLALRCRQAWSRGCRCRGRAGREGHGIVRRAIGHRNRSNHARRRVLGWKSVRWNGADVAIAESRGRTDGKCEWSAARSTARTSTARGWRWAARARSIPTAARRSPSTWQPFARTSAARPCAGSRAPWQPYDHSARRRLEHLPRHRAGRGDRQGDRLQGRTAHPRAAVGHAHDEAENPRALLDTEVTVGQDGVVREIAVTWRPAWRYTVTYTDLGATPAPVAPENARPPSSAPRDQRRPPSSGARHEPARMSSISASMSSGAALFRRSTPHSAAMHDDEPLRCAVVDADGPHRSAARRSAVAWPDVDVQRPEQCGQWLR